MTKPLPWIIAILLFVLAGGAYLIWWARPRAVLHGQLHSANEKPSHSNAPPQNLKPLHVAGCDRDFLVRPGEILEPRVLPGSSIEQFRAVYGKESERDKNGPVTWDLYPYTLTDSNFGLESSSNFVSVDMNPGHIFKTLDGVELGIDTFGSILQRAKDGGIQVHESIRHVDPVDHSDQADGQWMLTLSLYSACSRKFRSEYRWTIPGSPEVDRQILPPNNGSTDPNAPWRSEVFMNKFVVNYDLEISNGTDKSGEGHPSIHDPFSDL
ncbi:hypothetical protein [Acidicapsa ligni]|uniref:hypothetical protein n=1 Tax=Acidicapsa ligni TaxID=542300 RepID=UPI0021E04C67|nr:hypothetical protein [Acidicapsa ligni]